MVYWLRTLELGEEEGGVAQHDGAGRVAVVLGGQRLALGVLHGHTRPGVSVCTTQGVSIW